MDWFHSMAIKLGKNFDSSKATKNLVRGFKLVPHVDRFLATWDELGFEFKYEPKQVDDAWHPSGDCTPCLNDLYHQALEHEYTKRSVTAASLKNFMVGHFWHQWLQWVISEKLQFATSRAIERRGVNGWGSKIVTNNGHNSRWKPFHWATGSADIAPCTIPDEGEWLIDFKTMNARHFAQNEPPADYQAKWECQLNIYMGFFDLERAMIFGICKDSPHEFKEFHYTRNQSLIDAIYGKWELVSECLDQGVEPPNNLAWDWELPLKGTSS